MQPRRTPLTHYPSTQAGDRLWGCELLTEGKNAVAFPFPLGEERRGVLCPDPSPLKGAPGKWWGPGERLSPVSPSRVDSYSGHQTCLCSQEGGDGTEGDIGQRGREEKQPLLPMFGVTKRHGPRASWKGVMGELSFQHLP